ncbi:hypothetical protein SAMN05216582_12075 [Selenomonas ruminantium]|uniref:Uncharacterized protein n=1 Tax=Selenomonas ruminantium TaxID=971 RepID=A0A1M6VU51_SELRU|nr:hypothetical protein SAMN05216582_12075 [Selenomonas ruminantium]
MLWGTIRCEGTLPGRGLLWRHKSEHFGWIEASLIPILKFLHVFRIFSKKVLTYAQDSCNIIQVADRYGNETAQQALIGRPLKNFRKLRKNFKKVLDKLI